MQMCAAVLLAVCYASGLLWLLALYSEYIVCMCTPDLVSLAVITASSESD